MEFATSKVRCTRLPAATLNTGMPLPEALARRRSHREFQETPLSIPEISQLCWAGQGVTHPEGFRTAPSAGALYPLTLLLADTQGVHEYVPSEHCLLTQVAVDIRKSLQQASFDQQCVGDAPVCFAITMRPERLTPRYGERSERYCLLESGHVAQNLLLQATALGLTGVPVGAFRDRQVDKTLKVPAGCRTVYLLAIGHSAR